MFDLLASTLALLALAGFCFGMIILLLWDEHIKPWRSEKRRRRTYARSSSPASLVPSSRTNESVLRKSNVG